MFGVKIKWDNVCEELDKTVLKMSSNIMLSKNLFKLSEMI